MNDDPVREIATLINANGVRVVEFMLAPKASGAWHYHSQMSEYCYCLKGQLSVEFAGHEYEIVSAGDKCEIPAGVVHRVRNESEATCNFLVVQGIGAYDFVRSNDLSVDSRLTR